MIICDQFIYTSSKWNCEHAAGFGVMQKSDGITADELAEAIPFCMYTKPDELTAYPKPQELDKYPVEFSFHKLSSGRTQITMSRYLGMCPSDGRGGNFIAHSIICKNPCDPFIFYNSSIFLKAVPEEFLKAAQNVDNNSADWSPPPALPQINFDESISASPISINTGNTEYFREIGMCFGFFEQALNTSNGVVLFDAMNSETVSTMRKLKEWLPANITDEMAVSTYRNTTEFSGIKSDENPKLLGIYGRQTDFNRLSGLKRSEKTPKYVPILESNEDLENLKIFTQKIDGKCDLKTAFEVYNIAYAKYDFNTARKRYINLPDKWIKLLSDAVVRIPIETLAKDSGYYIALLAKSHNALIWEISNAVGERTKIVLPELPDDMQQEELIEIHAATKCGNDVNPQILTFIKKHYLKILDIEEIPVELEVKALDEFLKNENFSRYNPKYLDQIKKFSPLLGSELHSKSEAYVYFNSTPRSDDIPEVKMDVEQWKNLFGWWVKNFLKFGNTENRIRNILRVSRLHSELFPILAKTLITEEWDYINLTFLKIIIDEIRDEPDIKTIAYTFCEKMRDYNKFKKGYGLLKYPNGEKSWRNIVSIYRGKRGGFFSNILRGF